MLEHVSQIYSKIMYLCQFHSCRESFANYWFFSSTLKIHSRTKNALPPNICFIKQQSNENLFRNYYSNQQFSAGITFPHTDSSKNVENLYLYYRLCCNKEKLQKFIVIIESIKMLTVRRRILPSERRSCNHFHRTSVVY